MAVCAKESELSESGRFAGLQGVDGPGVMDINDAVTRQAAGLCEIETTCFALQATLLPQYVFLLGLDKGTAALKMAVWTAQIFAFFRLLNAWFVVTRQRISLRRWAFNGATNGGYYGG